MKTMKEEMEADLSDAQKTEKTRAATFAELKAAKTDEIASGEKLAEQKEDELATAQNDLAEAKEDLGQTSKALAEFQTLHCSERWRIRTLRPARKLAWTRFRPYLKLLTSL